MRADRIMTILSDAGDANMIDSHVSVINIDESQEGADRDPRLWAGQALIGVGCAL
jgi:hypothetical protein